MMRASLALRSQGLRADELDEIQVFGHAGVCGLIQGSPHAYRPVSHEDADHSTPFVVATAWLRGRLTAADYHGEPWLNPAVQQTMDRVRLIQEPDREQARRQEGIIGCRVVARLRDGRALTAEVEQPQGHPDAPLSDEQLLSKMQELAPGWPTNEAAASLLAACESLPPAPNLDSLFEVVRSLSSAG